MEKELFIQLDSGKEVEMFNQAALTNKCLQFSNGAMYPVAGMPPGSRSTTSSWRRWRRSSTRHRVSRYCARMPTEAMPSGSWSGSRRCAR